MRRWTLRLLVLLVFVLLAVGITAHLVLRSDWPRTMVIDILQEQTGLRIEMREMRTGWSGRTNLKDLAVSLPLHDAPFITVPQISVTHTSLLWLILTRSLDLEDLIIDEPHVHLATDASGQWNFVQAADLITQTQQRRDGTASDGMPTLPRLRINSAIVDVTAPTGDVVRYDPIHIEGDPDGALAWNFSVMHEPRVRLEGRLAPQAGWAHHLTFDVEEIRSLIEPWLPEAPEEFGMAGRWQGQVRDAVLTGRLELDEFRAASLTAEGTVNAHVVGFDVRIEPIDVRAAIDESPVGQMGVTGGRIEVNLESVRATRVRLYADDLQAQLDGEWHMASERGEVEIAWTGDASIWPLAHDGRLSATARRTALGQLSASAAIESNGRWEQAQWQTRLQLIGQGDSWRDLRGSLEADRLLVRAPDGSIDLGGMRTQLQAQWPHIVLTDLHVPGMSLPDGPSTSAARGDARIDVETLVWDASIEGRDWLVPLTLAQVENAAALLGPLTFAMHATGDRTHADVHQFSAEHAELSVEAAGNLQFDQLRLDMTSTIAARPSNLPMDIDPDLIHADLVIQGTLQPLALVIAGDVAADNVRYQGRPLGELRSALHGEVQPGVATIALVGFDLLDGAWQASSAIDMENWIASVQGHGRDVDLALLSSFVNLPTPLLGRGEAQLVGTIPLRAIDQATLEGSWAIQDAHAAGLDALHGDGLISVRDGVARVTDVRLMHRGGMLSGRGELVLAQPDRAQVSLELTGWPVVLETYEVSSLVRGHAELELDLITLQANGELDFDVDLQFRGDYLGAAQLVATLDGRQLTLHDVRADVLDAHITAAGMIMLDPERWMESRLSLAWSDLDFARLVTIADFFEPLQGTSYGELTIRRSLDPRAPEPMRLDISAHVDHARYREITLGDEVDDAADVVAVGHFSPDRLLIDGATLNAVGGTIALWGRITRHDDEYAAHVRIDLTDLDLEQLAHAAALTTEPMPGRVSGWWSVGGYLSEDPRLFGRAQLSLSESDLIALPGIAQIFDALSLRIGSMEPTGSGVADIRMEGNAMEISRLVYINRGANVVARLRIDDLWAAGSSPIRGRAIGVVRPLGELNVSFLEVFDRLIIAAQSDAASVRLFGTLNSVQHEVVPLPQIAGSLQRLFSGKVE